MCNVVEKNEVIGVLWKTVSQSCNLACDYCYYSDCGGDIDHSLVISDEVLEKFIKEYMEVSSGAAVFTWQGGEPLLAGLDFFEKVVYYQANYAPENTIISNSIQTNATLLNEKWAEFFKKYNFLVGVSIDGLKELNDRRRVTGSGAGSFDLAMDGISKLRRAGVDFNILTVIHENNVNEVSALMNFYKEYDFRFVQFLPCMNFTSQDHGRGGGEYVITPIEYGDFLCEVFDFWYNEGNPQMSIRFFDNLLSSYLHLDAEICTHQQSCPKHMIMESNGVAYPCDFFMNEKFTLGNIQVDSLQEIISRMDRHEFYNYKQNLPSKCLRCDHLKRCYGGCPRNRDVKDLDSTDYFCESYQMIYQYSSEKMSLLANNIKKQYLQDYIHKGLKLPDRNEACLCGSGMKFKKCCQHISSGC